MFERIIKHLLPRALAWRTYFGSKLRALLAGLSGTGDDTKSFIDDVYDDGFPQTTRELDQWEPQFGMSADQLTEQQRRDRLDATWKAVGGQSPRYIQDTLQAAGFDVYVHEWWEPLSDPPVARNPLSYLQSGTALSMQAGESIAQAGEPHALAGDSVTTEGSALQNRTLNPSDTPPVIPADPTKWPFFFYVGAETFPDLADVPEDRRDEFETLLLQIGPAHLWIGLLIDYTAFILDQLGDQITDQDDDPLYE